MSGSTAYGSQAPSPASVQQGFLGQIPGILAGNAPAGLLTFNSQPVPTTTPTPAPTPVPGPTTGLSNASASATLTAMLAPYGLTALVQPALDLYNTGVTDSGTILDALENTQAFQARFPGLRDATTGQLIGTPAEYVSYEKTVRQQFAAASLAPPTQEQIGNYFQQRRSTTELDTDIKAYTELKQNPYIANQFTAITGINPGPEGLFALLTGQAPNLEKTYQAAVNGGVTAEQYAQRMSAITGTHSAEDVMNALSANPDQNGLFNTQPGQLNSMDATKALMQAEAANKSSFMGSGGQSLVDTGKLFHSF